jgi:hypothetical protein
MKSHWYAALVIGLLALPTASFAQDADVSLTHKDVQADLIRLEQAGYRPSKLHYPADIQSAEARLDERDVTASSNNGVGGVPDGSSQTSAPKTVMGAGSIYAHH